MKTYKGVDTIQALEEGKILEYVGMVYKVSMVYSIVKVKEVIIGN
ncbi:hypothetical protein AB1283_26165 [Bacillus sp. S13(2024)]